MEHLTVPSISVSYARNGNSTKVNALGMRPMQERAYEKRGEQHLLIKSPPASGKSRALMFIALDKLNNQGLKQAIIIVPEKTIGASFSDEPLTKFGFWADWKVEPKWNLCNAPGSEGGKVNSLGAFLEPKSKEAERICQEDLNEVIAAFVQDKTNIERGMFDEELVPEELTQVRMGKIIKDKYPELDEEDQEAVSTPEQISTIWPEQRYTSLALRKVVHRPRPAAWPCSRRSGPGPVGKLGSDRFGLAL